MYRFSKFLSDSLLLCACCIFLVSTLNPFIISNYYFSRWGQMPVIRNFTVVYWSYKASSGNGDEVFLNSYWFNNADPALTNYLGISWFLVIIFLLQILTLTSGIFSLLKTRKIRIIPVVSSVIVLLLMIQVYVKASGVGLGLKTYNLGYWLTYPSILLFLLSFTICIGTKEDNGQKQISSTPTHTSFLKQDYCFEK
jgi:hypothetical protein